MIIDGNAVYNMSKDNATIAEVESGSTLTFITCFLLIALGFLCSSFSSILCWKLTLLINTLILF